MYIKIFIEFVTILLLLYFLVSPALEGKVLTTGWPEKSLNTVLIWTYKAFLSVSQDSIISWAFESVTAFRKKMEEDQKWKKCPNSIMHLHLHLIINGSLDAENSASVQWCLIESQRVMGKVEKKSFIALSGKWGHSGLLPLKTVSHPGRICWGVFQQWFKDGVADKDQDMCVQGLHPFILTSGGLLINFSGS